jgi:hypothetical protein
LRTRGAVIWRIAVAVFAAGCSRGEKNTGAPGGVRAEVQVPIGQGPTSGSYTIAVDMPGGRKQHITGQRDGSINGRWVADVTGDGVPEIIVWMTSAGRDARGTAHLYEKRGDQFVLRTLADLPSEAREGYKGHDIFEVVNGTLRRRFPQFASSDPEATPSGRSVRLRYSFTEDRWVEE